MILTASLNNQLQEKKKDSRKFIFAGIRDGGKEIPV
jgi:hypothetical protein